MSSIGQSGLSNISPDALQTRYEKALKQINKLIEINRQLKGSAYDKDKHISGLNAQIANLQQKIYQLDVENNILDQKYMVLSQHCKQVENYCKELMLNIENNNTHKNIEEKMRQCQVKYNQNIEKEANKYKELAQRAEIMQLTHQKILNVIQAKEEQSKVREQLLVQNQQQMKKLEQENHRLKENLKENSKQILNKKLQQANNTIQKLIKECSELKNKLIDLEVFYQKKKLQSYWGYSLIHNSSQNDAMKLLIEEYLKKINELQKSKRDLQVKYKHLRYKFQHIISQNNQSKIQRLQRLTQKQQMEIDKLIQTYDRQINYMFKQNKKLIDGFYSLSSKYQQKSIDLEQKEKQLSQLKYSTQKVSFENQSLKKLNLSLVEAKNNSFSRDQRYSRKDFQQQSLTIIQKKQSKQKIGQIKKYGLEKVNEGHNMSFYPKRIGSCRPNVKKLVEQKMQMNYAKAIQPDFRFIQSMNIMTGFTVNVGQNSHRFKK